MEIEKLNDVMKEFNNNVNKIKKGELLIARIVEKKGQRSLLVNIKGKNYNAFVKEKISGDIFLAKVLRVSPKLVLKFVENLGKNATKSKISNYFFNFKKEFIQKLITSDNFVVDDFINISETTLLESEKDIIPLFKKYLSSWYSPILKGVFSKKVNFNFSQKLYHKFLVFQSLYNVYNLEHLSFFLPLKIGEKKYFFNMIVLNRKNDLSQSIFVKIYFNKDLDVLVLIYLDQKLINCSLSSNDERFLNNIKGNVGILSDNLTNKILGKELKINIVPYDYLSKIDDRNFKTIDIRM